VLAGFWWGNPRERDNLKERDLHGRLMIKRIFEKWDGDVPTGLIWFRIRIDGGRLCSNEPLGFMKFGESCE
jgi:hypothetical protein